MNANPTSDSGKDSISAASYDALYSKLEDQRRKTENSFGWLRGVAAGVLVVLSLQLGQLTGFVHNPSQDTTDRLTTLTTLVQQDHDQTQMIRGWLEGEQHVELPHTHEEQYYPVYVPYGQVAIFATVTPTPNPNPPAPTSAPRPTTSVP